VEVIARNTCDGREHGKRPDGETVDFNQTHGGTVDFGGWRVQYQTLALQEAETTIEPVNAGAGADYRDGDAIAS